MMDSIDMVMRLRREATGGQIDRLRVPAGHDSPFDPPALRLARDCTIPCVLLSSKTARYGKTSVEAGGCVFRDESWREAALNRGMRIHRPERIGA
jgi:hypothetical protein